MSRQHHIPTPDDLELAYELGYQDGRKSASLQDMGEFELNNAYMHGWYQGHQDLAEHHISTGAR